MGATKSAKPFQVCGISAAREPPLFLQRARRGRVSYSVAEPQIRQRI
jgi:hypothetical protein